MLGQAITLDIPPEVTATPADTGPPVPWLEAITTNLSPLAWALIGLGLLVLIRAARR